MFSVLKYFAPVVINTGNVSKLGATVLKDTVLKKQPTKVKKTGEKNIVNGKKFKGMSHLENRIRKILEFKYGLPFRNVRMDSMINPFTKRKLEIDLYCDELKLGVEINGIQHYDANSHFYDKNAHKISKAQQFAKQKERDLIKQRLCKENNITLVVINDNEIRKDWLDDEIFNFIQTRINGLN